MPDVLSDAPPCGGPAEDEEEEEGVLEYVSLGASGPGRRNIGPMAWSPRAGSMPPGQRPAKRRGKNERWAVLSKHTFQEIFEAALTSMTADGAASGQDDPEGATRMRIGLEKGDKFIYATTANTASTTLRDSDPGFRDTPSPHVLSRNQGHCDHEKIPNPGYMFPVPKTPDRNQDYVLYTDDPDARESDTCSGANCAESDDQLLGQAPVLQVNKERTDRQTCQEPNQLSVPEMDKKVRHPHVPLSDSERSLYCGEAPRITPSGSTPLDVNKEGESALWTRLAVLADPIHSEVPVHPAVVGPAAADCTLLPPPCHHYHHQHLAGSAGVETRAANNNGQRGQREEAALDAYVAAAAALQDQVVPDEHIYLTTGETKRHLQQEEEGGRRCVVDGGGSSVGGFIPAPAALGRMDGMEESAVSPRSEDGSSSCGSDSLVDIETVEKEEGDCGENGIGCGQYPGQELASDQPAAPVMSSPECVGGEETLSITEDIRGVPRPPDMMQSGQTIDRESRPVWAVTESVEKSLDKDITGMGKDESDVQKVSQTTEVTKTGDVSKGDPNRNSPTRLNSCWMILNKALLSSLVDRAIQPDPEDSAATPEAALDNNQDNPVHERGSPCSSHVDNTARTQPSTGRSDSETHVEVQEAHGNPSKYMASSLHGRSVIRPAEANVPEEIQNKRRASTDSRSRHRAAKKCKSTRDDMDTTESRSGGLGDARDAVPSADSGRTVESVNDRGLYGGTLPAPIPLQPLSIDPQTPEAARNLLHLAYDGSRQPLFLSPAHLSHIVATNVILQNMFARQGMLGQQQVAETQSLPHLAQPGTDCPGVVTGRADPAFPDNVPFPVPFFRMDPERVPLDPVPPRLRSPSPPHPHPTSQLPSQDGSQECRQSGSIPAQPRWHSEITERSERSEPHFGGPQHPINCDRPTKSQASMATASIANRTPSDSHSTTRPKASSTQSNNGIDDQLSRMPKKSSSGTTTSKRKPPRANKSGSLVQPVGSGVKQSMTGPKHGWVALSKAEVYTIVDTLTTRLITEDDDDVLPPTRGPAEAEDPVHHFDCQKENVLHDMPPENVMMESSEPCKTPDSVRHNKLSEASSHPEQAQYGDRDVDRDSRRMLEADSMLLFPTSPMERAMIRAVIDRRIQENVRSSSPQPHRPSAEPRSPPESPKVPLQELPNTPPERHDVTDGKRKGHAAMESSRHFLPAGDLTPEEVSDNHVLLVPGLVPETNPLSPDAEGTNDTVSPTPDSKVFKWKSSMLKRMQHEDVDVPRDVTMTSEDLTLPPNFVSQDNSQQRSAKRSRRSMVFDGGKKRPRRPAKVF